MVLTLKNPSRLVRTANYVKKVQPAPKPWEKDLSRAVRKSLTPFLADGGSTEEFDEDPYSRLAEKAVAKLFDVEVEPATNPGYDVDSRGIILDGVDYGRIEVRCRTMLRKVDKQTGRISWRIDPLSEKDVRSKMGMFEWLFVCMWDVLEEELVWFRIPGYRALRNKSLVINRQVGGGYGWANEFIWCGPEAEHSSLYF
jgi:hypothetical protein